MTTGIGTAVARDIENEQDVAGIVWSFYDRAFRDPLLGPVFVDVARLDLSTHLPVLCDFWMTVLFRAGRYSRNALLPHVRLHQRSPLTDEHFDRWLRLWCQTVQERHAGPVAEHAQVQAERMASSLRRRLAAPEELVVPSRRS